MLRKKIQCDPYLTYRGGFTFTAEPRSLPHQTLSVPTVLLSLRYRGARTASA